MNGRENVKEREGKCEVGKWPKEAAFLARYYDEDSFNFAFSRRKLVEGNERNKEIYKEGKKGGV